MAVKKELESSRYSASEIKDYEIGWIAKEKMDAMTLLDDEKMDTLMSLLQELEDREDVVSVVHNTKIDD